MTEFYVLPFSPCKLKTKKVFCWLKPCKEILQSLIFVCLRVFYPWQKNCWKLYPCSILRYSNSQIFSYPNSILVISPKNYKSTIVSYWSILISPLTLYYPIILIENGLVYPVVVILQVIQEVEFWLTKPLLNKCLFTN